MTEATFVDSFGSERSALPFGRWSRSVRRFIRTQPLGAVSALVIFVVVGAAILAPLLNTTDPTKFGTSILAHPGADHWFGTNRDGRDMYSRVLYGGRVSLLIGFATVSLSMVGGTLLALVAGYIGGAADLLISRIGEGVQGIPTILFALTMATTFGSGLTTLTFSISLAFTPVIMRIMRAAVIQQRGLPYVEAARVVGASEVRIMLRHVLPNLTSLMIVVASGTLPAAILTESALSYLGVGVAFGEPSWGADLGGKAREYFQRAWWIAIFPGAALSITVLSFNLLGDSLRDVLDPRLRGVR
jgi:ABC-type dipeptide/oligopeptide/nickel transport system permease subunit